MNFAETSQSLPDERAAFLSAAGAFSVWRAEVVNLPSRAYSCILAETALHITRRIFHWFSIGSLRNKSGIKQSIAVRAFYKMHLNSYGEFHSTISCPESKRSLAEPMRVVWLSASFLRLVGRSALCSQRSKSSAGAGTSTRRDFLNFTPKVWVRTYLTNLSAVRVFLYLSASCR